MAIHASRETEELGKRESPGGRAKAMADATDSTTEIQIRLDRLRSGDESARDELLEIARARLGRLARKMLRGYPGVRRWEQTDDILQNVALRLCRALKGIRPESVRGFIRLAAVQIRRELIDLARHYKGPEGPGRHQISRAGPDDEGAAPGPPDPPADTDDPARLASWTEFHETVEALPEAEREVFDILWYQGLTQREAAALLGVTERVAKRRWRAARLTLHQRLGGRMPG
jgi:RNA polymerase sigma factor (sigma-70 family)